MKDPGSEIRQLLEDRSARLKTLLDEPEWVEAERLKSLARLMENELWESEVAAKVLPALRETPQASRQGVFAAAARESQAVLDAHIKQLARQGVIYASLTSALKEHEALVRQYWPPAPSSIWELLESALWERGLFLYVPEGVALPDDLPALTALAGESEEGWQRSLLIVEPRAEAGMVTGCVNVKPVSHPLHAAGFHVHLKAGAKFVLTELQNSFDGRHDVSSRYGFLESGAELTWRHCHLAASRSYVWPVFKVGKDARVAYEGLWTLPPGDDVRWGLHFNGDPSASSVDMRAVLPEGAALTFDGEGISPEKWKAQFLALGAGARLHSKHMATGAQVAEDDEGFWLARGWTAAAARQLLVQDFVAAFVEKVPLEYGVEIDNALERQG